MTVFEEVKSAVDIRSAAEMYGLKVSKNGMTLCPFHPDKNPSAKIYPDNFHCFGCGLHMDVISFTQKLFNLDKPIDAVKKLNHDFGLNICVDKSPSKSEIALYHKMKQEREMYAQWEKSAWQTLCLYLRLMMEWGSMAPSSPDEPLDNRFVYALHHLDYAEYLNERFMELPYERRIEMKKAVSSIAEFLDCLYSD